MRKTTQYATDRKITVDIKGLQAMLSVGRATAENIGIRSGAVIRVGRRKLYNVAKVNAYMEQLAEL